MSDIEKALGRKEIARRDCPTCKGRGWVGNQGVDEQLCEVCGGTGMEEKEVPFLFDQTKPRTPAELAAEAFGEPIPERKPVSGSDL